MTKDFSIIIPTYKRIETLRTLLSKLNNLNFKRSIEIIIVDQNEGDLVLSLAEEYLEIPFIWIKQKKPNASAARNNGANVSNGEFLFFIDDDLEPEIDFLERAFSILKTNNITALIPCVYNDNGIQHERAKMNSLVINKTISNLRQITESISAAMFFKRDTYFRTGGFDPVLFDYVRSTEDQEFFKRIALRKIKLYYHEDLSIYHSEEISGGCNLRENGYLENRKNFIKGWCFRYRVHNGYPYKLKMKNVFSLFRSAFLNKEIIERDIKYSYILFTYCLEAIAETKDLMHSYVDFYRDPKSTSHFELSKKYL